MALAGLAASAPHLEAGHSRPLASEGVRSLLDVEVPPSLGRPRVASAIRDLIQQMCQANFLWGASGPRFKFHACADSGWFLVSVAYGRYPWYTTAWAIQKGQ
jgi:hypothetical protein